MWRTSLLLLLLSVQTVSADGLQALISVTQTAPVAGRELSFTLFFHNNSDGRQTLSLPQHLVCFLENETQSKHMRAVLSGPLPAGDHLLETRTFLATHYTLGVPGDMEGIWRLRVVDFQAQPVLVALSAARTGREVGARRDAETENKRVAQDPSLSEDPSLDELFTLYQPYVANISAYEPMYFLVGADPKKSKFQISLQYRFFNAQSPLGARYPWLRGAHFGYTQTSFWDLKSDSAPFEDTSYKPEFFYLTENLDIRPSWMKGFFLQTGACHESNGRGGDESRSTNTLYIEPVFIFYDPPSRLGLQVSPRISAYVLNADDTNRDLPDYRGSFDLELKMGKAEGLVLGSIFRFASEGASVQLDLTYPMHRLSDYIGDIYLQAQYVDALAESLLDFRERSQAFRFGFSIVR